MAEKAGVDLELLQRASAALGVPYPDPDERTLTEADLEAAKRVKAFIDAGLPEDGMLQVARTIGIATARIAEANRELIVRTLIQPGDTERDLAPALRRGRRDMLPLVGRRSPTRLRAHLLEQIRRDVIGAADLAAGEIGGADEVCGLLRRPGRASPSSARRSRPKSSGSSPAGWRRWRPRSPSRRCGS